MPPCKRTRARRRENRDELLHHRSREISPSRCSSVRDFSRSSKNSIPCKFTRDLVREKLTGIFHILQKFIVADRNSSFSRNSIFASQNLSHFIRNLSLYKSKLLILEELINLRKSRKIVLEGFAREFEDQLPSRNLDAQPAERGDGRERYLRAPPAPLNYLSHIEQTQFPAVSFASANMKFPFHFITHA